MKKSILSVVLVVLGLGVFAQPSLYKKGDWKVGEIKTISGTNIKKIEGENSETSITNIGYQSQPQILAELKLRKKNGTIGGDRYKNEVERYKKYCAGGYVQLYITRPTQEACNPKWFHLDVMDKDGKLLFEKDYKDEKSYRLKGEVEGYRCSSQGFIQSEAFLPITINITESYNGNTSKYSYEVISYEK